MSLEFIEILENKVDQLLLKVSNLKAENDTLYQEIELSQNRITSLEQENSQLKDELVSLKSTSEEDQKRFTLASERIQGLISKLELVQ